MWTINISFQIMTRAEPVALVKETIDSLLVIKDANDEILIVDNNHSDKALYEPLQAYCESLDDSLKVRFFHKDHIAGYKAGALNYALHKMDDDCEYIVVVDSDYQALPWARSSIASAIKTYPKHALLQFPQYYRDTDKPDIHGELNHYFSKHLRAKNNLIHSLSTGTFAVINRRALERLGGWSGDSITEDAQMGVLMHLKEECTRYIPYVIATGILPSTLSDLIAQRRRWIYGNVQVLASYPKMLFKQLYTRYKGRHCNHMLASLNTESTPQQPKPFCLSDFHKVRAHLSQLSAWINLTGGFIVLQMLCLAILVGVSVFNLPALAPLTLNILYICYLGYGVFIGRRLFAYLTDNKPLLTPYGGRLNGDRDDWTIDVQNDAGHTVSNISRLKAWLIHMSFWELGALSWLPVLWGQQKPFVCTPKFTVLDEHKNSRLAAFMAMPKLLIVLNGATAVAVFPYSKLLFVAALTLLLVKLLSHWTMMKNFDNKLHKVSKPDELEELRLNKCYTKSLAAKSSAFESSKVMRAANTETEISNTVMSGRSALEGVHVWGRYDNVLNSSALQDKRQAETDFTNSQIAKFNANKKII